MQKENKVYRICLMGASLETGNRGVSALAVSLVKNIREIKSNADISFLIGNKEPRIREINISGQSVKVNIINFRLSPKAKLHEHLFFILLMAVLYRIIPINKIRIKITRLVPWLQALKEACFVGDIHAGDSFSDIYGLKRMIIGLLPDLVVFLMKKELILLPQTYGPYRHTIAKGISKLIFKNSFKIISRDLEGLDVLKNILGEQEMKNKVFFCPDVAFSLDPIYGKKPDVFPSLKNRHGSLLVGFNINGLMYNGGYTQEDMFGLKSDYKSLVYQLAKRILNETSIHILLVPHTYGPPGNINSDPDACQDVFNLLKGSSDNIHILRGEYDQSEIKSIIGMGDFFIGSRMHACIAALSQGIPTVGVAYSRKFKGVFESVGIGDMVADARYLETDDVIKKIINSLYNREKIKIDLEYRIEGVKARIRNTFRDIL